MTIHKDDSKVTKNEILIISTLVFLAVVCVCIAIIPDARQKVKNAFISKQRKIIAKVDGNLGNSQNLYTVFKLKEGNELFIELYSPDEDGNLTLINKSSLYDSHDGYLDVKDAATNLAIMDFDKDGANEIVAPTYDSQMVPRLNIFKLNERNGLDRVAAPEDFKY